MVFDNDDHSIKTGDISLWSPQMFHLSRVVFTSIKVDPFSN